MDIDLKCIQDTYRVDINLTRKTYLHRSKVKVTRTISRDIALKFIYDIYINSPK